MNRLTRSLAVSMTLAALALAFTAVPAAADTALTTDLYHTSAGFTVTHLTLSKVTGVVPVTSVKVTIGSNNLPTSAEASFDLTKINTQNERRDDDLRSDKFFDTAKFPTMTFRATKITPGSGGAFTMTGDLTMHGITKSVTLNGSFLGQIKDPVTKGEKTRYGFSAAGTIDRTQWNVGPGYPPAIVSNDIVLNFQMEAVN